MQTTIDPVHKDMETMSMEDFSAMYCADEAKTPCTDCEECQRSGACCLTCRFRQDCPIICDSEKTRKKLDALPVEEFCKKLRDYDEHLLTFAAAERLRTAETHIAELMEKHLKKCLSCEKLDLMVQIVELNGSLENLRNLITTEQKMRLEVMNEWLSKYNIPYDCNWRNAIDKLIAGGRENHDQ